MASKLQGVHDRNRNDPFPLTRLICLLKMIESNISIHQDNPPLTLNIQRIFLVAKDSIIVVQYHKGPHLQEKNRKELKIFVINKQNNLLPNMS